MAKDKNPKTVPVKFKWKEAEVDPRQFKPGKPTFEPINVYVLIDVPVKYIADRSEQLIQQLGFNSESRKGGDVVLTPDGVKYCITVLENSMGNFETKNFDDDEDIEWDE